MSTVSIEELKGKFSQGKKPTAQDYANLFDSFFHRDVGLDEVVPRATQPEAEQGIDNEKVMTPLTTNQAIVQERGINTTKLNDLATDLIESLIDVTDPNDLVILKGGEITIIDDDYTITEGAALYQGELFKVLSSAFTVAAAEIGVFKISDNNYDEYTRSIELISGASGSEIMDHDQVTEKRLIASEITNPSGQTVNFPSGLTGNLKGTAIDFEDSSFTGGSWTPSYLFQKNSSYIINYFCSGVSIGGMYLAARFNTEDLIIQEQIKVGTFNVNVVNGNQIEFEHIGNYTRNVSIIRL